MGPPVQLPATPSPPLEPRTKGAAAPPPRAPLAHPSPPPEWPGREANSRTSSEPHARLEPTRQWVLAATHSPARTPENARQTTAQPYPAPFHSSLARARADRLRHWPSRPLPTLSWAPKLSPPPRLLAERKRRCRLVVRLCASAVPLPRRLAI